MNQAGCACAYVYDCCKLLQVFSAPVYPDRRHRLSTLSSSPWSSSSSSFSSSSPSYMPLFLFYLFVPALIRFFFCAVPQRLHPPGFEGCTSSSGVHRTSCSSCLLNRLDTRLNYTRHREFRRTVFFRSFIKCYEKVHRAGYTNTKAKSAPSSHRRAYTRVQVGQKGNVCVE